MDKSVLGNVGRCRFLPHDLTQKADENGRTVRDQLQAGMGA